jgi:hypothetical protein
MSVWAPGIVGRVENPLGRHAQKKKTGCDSLSSSGRPTSPTVRVRDSRLGHSDEMLSLTVPSSQPDRKQVEGFGKRIFSFFTEFAGLAGCADWLRGSNTMNRQDAKCAKEK